MPIDVSSAEMQVIASTTEVKPFSFDAEQALLGGILINPSCFASVVRLLANENDFYYEQHRLVFSSMQSLSMRSIPQPIDILSLKLDLEQKQLLSKVGGESYLLSLQNKAPITQDITSYANTVSEKAKSRRMLEACQKIIKDIHNPKGKTISEIIDMAEGEMFKVSDSANNIGVGPRPIAESIMHVINELKENKSGKNTGVTGVSTGYAVLDQKTSGFHPGQLIIVAARPAMGKTTFAMNLIENIALRGNTGKPALVFSLEMRSVEIASRLIASMARIDQNNIRNCTLSMDDWKNLMVAMKSLIDENSNSPIYIDDQSSLTPLDIRSRARRLAKDKGGLSAIMVDYLQLMRVPGYGENRTLEVAECSRSLKALAKELDVPVIALAQLNRGLEGRKDKKPMPSDLRESGSIEQDADMILFVHREEVYNTNDPELQGKAEIIIGKNRSGETGKMDTVFLKEYSRFEGIDYRSEQEQY
jgi:replicative DNA helicase